MFLISKLGQYHIFFLATEKLLLVLSLARKGFLNVNASLYNIIGFNFLCEYDISP